MAVVPSCIFVTLLLVCPVFTTGPVYIQPEQIHIAYGDDSTQMVITWSTLNDTGESIVEFGTSELDSKAVGTSTLFVDGGKQKRQQYIHRVKIFSLEPSTKYWYHCGSNYGWSNLFYFNTPPATENWSPQFAMFGDMGNENAQSLPRLQEEVERKMYDAILHVGDFAYDMNDDDGRVGDEFMRQIESIAAYVPYMVCVGNHESAYNFSNYKYRFSVPGSENNLMYSFDLGPIHFIAVSSEFYYYLSYGIKQIVKQYNWLENDLRIANLPENRKKAAVDCHFWSQAHVLFQQRP